MDIEIKVLPGNIYGIPDRGSNGAAACDLRSNEAGFVLTAGSIFKVRTGIAIHIKDTRYAALIIPRSGLGSKGIILANGSGLIDSDYQGEIMVPLWNRSDQDFKIDSWDRIAQMIIIPVIKPDWIKVEEFSGGSERGIHGFGSTGTK